MAGSPDAAYVYVLEVGCYDQAYIVGVFASPEAAMAAHSPKRPNPKDYRARFGHAYGDRANELWSYEWSGPNENGGYRFWADWDDAASITRYEVQA